MFSAIDGASQVGAYALDTGNPNGTTDPVLNTTRKGIDNAFIKRTTNSFKETNVYQDQLDDNGPGIYDSLHTKRYNRLGIYDPTGTSIPDRL